MSRIWVDWVEASRGEAWEQMFLGLIQAGKSVPQGSPQ